MTTLKSKPTNNFSAEETLNNDNVDFAIGIGRRVVLFDSSGNEILAGAGTSLVDGRKTVTVAATAEQLSAASVSCKSVTLTALRSNTGIIAVGASTVVAAAGTERGAILNPLDSVKLFVKNLNLIWLDSTVSGEGVSYFYEA